MARRTQTYAIRLAVEGSGQVKAELVSVGQGGDGDGSGSHDFEIIARRTSGATRNVAAGALIAIEVERGLQM